MNRSPAASRPLALVTGSSRGIGRAIVLELAGSGHDVVVNYAGQQDAAEATADEARQSGARALVVQADISRRSDRERLLQTVRDEFGRLDVLVNNAAIAPRERVSLLDTSEEHYDRTLDVNLKGPFFLSQAVARWMIETRRENAERRLYIVNISSVSEYAASVQRSDYCLAKAGTGMLTRLLADLLGEYEIPVNEVRPGVIATDMTAGVEEKYDRLFAEGLTPLRRWGRPEDVARAVRALVSGDFDYSTGAAFDVDGGFSFRRL